MIVQETIDGWTTLVRTYSNKNYMVQNADTGILYEEAIDPLDKHRTYVESNITISDYRAQFEMYVSQQDE